MMQWDWFEPRRVLIGEKKKKKAESGISTSGSVKFDLAGSSGKPDQVSSGEAASQVL